MPLTQEQINTLLAPKSRKIKAPVSNFPTGYPPPEQFGPLRWYDKEMRCANRGCGSSTYLKVEGIPICTTHALHKLNEMLIELGLCQKPQ